AWQSSLGTDLFRYLSLLVFAFAGELVTAYVRARSPLIGQYWSLCLLACLNPILSLTPAQQWKPHSPAARPGPGHGGRYDGQEKKGSRERCPSPNGRRKLLLYTQDHLGAAIQMNVGVSRGEGTGSRAQIGR